MRVLFTPKCPPEVPSWNDLNTSFTFVLGTVNCKCVSFTFAISHFLYRMPLHIIKLSHYAQ